MYWGRRGGCDYQCCGRLVAGEKSLPDPAASGTEKARYSGIKYDGYYWRAGNGDWPSPSAGDAGEYSCRSGFRQEAHRAGCADACRCPSLWGGTAGNCGALPPGTGKEDCKGGGHLKGELRGDGKPALACG